MIKKETLFVDKTCSILQALEKMDSLKRKLLLVMEGDIFKSVLSIGDIQRAIINKIPLESPIGGILRLEITVCSDLEPREEVKSKMLKARTEVMPIISQNGKLIDILFWEEIFGSIKRKKDISLNLPVIIMAGGKGTRLRPLTNVFPKPLLPINEKTIIEDIMDRFVDVGCNNFFISVNYKAKTVKSYFKDLNNSDYNISYFQEDKPLGTAGSMFLIRDKIRTPFFVSNCDILIDQDLEEIYEYHKRNENKITIVSALKSYKIPYGTIETGDNGLLSKMDEKPELVFQINTGMYLLEPEMLHLIPENTFYHITELIDKVKNENHNVGVFPIGENSWQDIGNWNDYKSVLKV
ncbi:nucleotidyltransferase family protein [Dokdonia sp. 4H-3-7-5]|uniref:nucleotidyltransferase family protein n=1 Tax=Dokdonia sp. (strain 4H-3-7-5) TaxID=983548 RepID=UPI00020A6DE1|nr:nucleotidyltransferase family protein [Dokdonia sp. 4H-3-7-5]AEE20747.1 Nucleotidyl transferase [Dokdonia sp. 4H-3-7-5]